MQSAARGWLMRSIPRSWLSGGQRARHHWRHKSPEAGHAIAAHRLQSLIHRNKVASWLTEPHYLGMTDALLSPAIQADRSMGQRIEGR